MNELSNPILWTIAACEIGFWVVITVGLIVRYIVRQQKLSTIILACVPLVDLVLLVAVTLDLHRGGEVGFAHRLAPLYLGVTLMFGHRVISWADARFAHHFADGPKPDKIPKYGSIRIRHEWQDFGRWLAAAAIALIITAGLGYTVADDVQRHAMFGITGTLGVVTVIWAVTGPVWYSLDRRA